MSSPYYDLVPKSPVENLRWRIRCRERALSDTEFRDVLWQACMEDVLFFCAFALWVYEPRSKHRRKPFIPWVHQEPLRLAGNACADVVVNAIVPAKMISHSECGGEIDARRPFCF